MSSTICSICNSPRSDSAGPCATCGAPPAAPARNLPAGTRLQNGRFTLGRVLGEGGFGITYLGTHRHLQRTVAIKELFPERAMRHGATISVPDSQQRDFHLEKERVLEEARVISRLDSPHIVGVHDAFLENNTAYIVMEYLEGQSLQERIEAQGPLPPHDVYRIAMAACDALTEVHMQSLLHRDISPDNIMLTVDGRMVLIDFGSARLFALGQTVRHTRILKKDYAAPEMFGSHAQFGPYTDIFCLGGTLYYALTGTVPPSFMDRLQNSHDELRFPIKLRGLMGDAIQKALQVRVEKRPQSATEFKSALLDPAIPIAKDEKVRLEGDATPLLLAVSKGALNEVSRLLASGANPNLQDKGKTPLHLAVPTGAVDVVKMLLKAGADPNVRDGQGRTVLHLAEIGSPIFEALLAGGADPNIAYEGGATPLHQAVSKGIVDAVGALLKAGADPNVRDGQGRTVLHLAEIGSLIFEVLLAGGADPNIAYEGGVTPLHRAVSEGIVDAVGVLLEAGADPNVRDGQGRTVLYLAEIGSPIFIAYEGGATPLHWAVSEGIVDAVGALLKAGADPCVRDGQGAMPLHLAVSTGGVDVVKMLLKAGADPNVRDGQGRTVLHLAETGSPIFEVLLAGGADRNQVYANGGYWVATKIAVVLALIAVVLAFVLATIWDVTPLRLAVSWNATHGVQALLRTGTNPNRQNVRGATSLHLAVAKGHLDSVSVLLESGADPNVQDGQGQMPLHMAGLGSPIFNALLAAGADPDIVYASGDAPLHVAVSEGLVDTVRVLLEAGADPNVQDGEGQTPLHLAELGFPIFNALLAAGAVYASGDAPLHVAVSEGLVDTVGVLLEAGAEPNIQDGQGQMPLHLAELGSPIFNALLAAGADPDIVYASGNAPLHVAVSEGLVDTVGVLLEAGVEPNVQNGEGRTPLHLAELGSPIFNALLAAGADPNIVYTSGGTPLHVAVSEGLVDTVGVLLEAGAEPNVQDGEGQTPLHMAGLGAPIFNALLAAGADPDIVYASGGTPLHVAVSEGLVDTVGTLLESGADPDAQDGEGQTPLHLAGLGSPSFNALLAAGADPNIVYASGDTPLHVVAVSEGLVDTVRALLVAGAEPNVQDGKGRTPLHLAGLGSPIFNALLAAGADPDIVYASGDTPLHVAVAEGLVDTIRVLLVAGAEPNVQDGKGRMPLHLAGLGSPIFNALLAAGADPDIVYASGNTPLHVAVAEGLVDTIRVLLEAGANLNVCNKDCNTPLHLAVSGRDLDLVDYLLKEGANPNVRNSHGNTPLHEAVRLNQNRIRRMFGNIQVQFADLLVKGGANPCIRNNHGATPLEMTEVSSTKKWLTDLPAGC
ncbi:MAG: ankyrin repeat domain-containing protein [Caldilineaceae bacterium]|nr:ankyrin repeat domain-containing protein [Caldilineaceae bacterium]